MSDVHCHICWKKIPFFLRASLLGRSKKKRSKLLPAHDEDIRHNAAILVMNHLGGCIQPTPRKAFISDSVEKCSTFKEMTRNDLSLLPDWFFHPGKNKTCKKSFEGTEYKPMSNFSLQIWLQHQLIALYLVRGYIKCWKVINTVRSAALAPTCGV